MAGGTKVAVDARVRADRIVAARVRGDTVPEIAEAEGMNRRSVHRVIAKEMDRRRSAPDATTEAARALALARTEAMLQPIHRRIQRELEDDGVISRDSVEMTLKVVDRMSKLAGLDTAVQQDHRITVDATEDLTLAERILIREP